MAEPTIDETPASSEKPEIGVSVVVNGYGEFIAKMDEMTDRILVFGCAAESAARDFKRLARQVRALKDDLGC